MMSIKIDITYFKHLNLFLSMNHPVNKPSILGQDQRK